MNVPECHGDVCITCSDQAVAVRIIELLPHDLAVVDTGSSMEEVSIALVSAGIGDEILVHAKEAIAVLRPSDLGPSEPGPSEPGPSEPGPSEPGPSEPGTSELGRSE